MDRLPPLLKVPRCQGREARAAELEIKDVRALVFPAGASELGTVLEVQGREVKVHETAGDHPSRTHIEGRSAKTQNAGPGQFTVQIQCGTTEKIVSYIVGHRVSGYQW